MTSWHQSAKCAGDDIRRYILDAGPGRTVRYQRPLKAESLCRGCPVIAECAQDALEHGDFGVVRAGLWLEFYGNQPGLVYKTREQLRERAYAYA